MSVSKSSGSTFSNIIRWRKHYDKYWNLHLQHIKSLDEDVKVVLEATG